MTLANPAPPSSKQSFRQLGVLMGLNFVDMIGSLMVLPLLPFYALNFHASAEMVGWLIASFSITQLITAPFWGRVSDRHGRRPALIIGLTASALAFTVFGLADALWLLFLSRIVQGAGGGTTGVAQAYVSDTVAPGDRAKALGWLSAATNAGVMIGPAIGSLATHLGRAAPGYIAAGLCFCNVIAAWLWLPESKTTSRPRERRPVWYGAWRVITNPTGRVERLTLVYGVSMLAFTLLTAVLALWLDARFGVTEKSIGYFFVYYGMLSLVFRLVLLGPVVDRIGETRTMRYGTLVLMIGLLLYPVAPSIAVLALIIPLVPMGTALLFPATTSLLSHAADPQEVGTTMGVAQTFAGIARVLAPIFGTILFQRISINAPFLAGGAIVALVAFVAFRFIPSPAPERSVA